MDGKVISGVMVTAMVVVGMGKRESRDWYLSRSSGELDSRHFSLSHSEIGVQYS